MYGITPRLTSPIRTEGNQHIAESKQVCAAMYWEKSEDSEEGNKVT